MVAGDRPSDVRPGLFVTIVGIPFGIQHMKLALIALAPVGMTVVPVRTM